MTIHHPDDAATDRTQSESCFGALESERGGLPLAAMDVRVQITGLLYRLELTQTFVNVHPVPLEATYIFPLPAQAAVNGFSFELDGRTVRGVLQERGKARREYTHAVHSGQTAAILEEERSDVFTVRLGNLPAGESVKVRFELQGPLEVKDGEATFFFPLVVAPRYIPGSALPGASVGDGWALDTRAVPDASRITPPMLLPGQPNPVYFSMQVDLDPAGLSCREIRCGLHGCYVQPGRAPGTSVVSLRPGVERLDRDFVLRFQVAETELQSSLVVLPDETGPGAHYMLTVVPPLASAHAVTPRDIVIVLDRSGSMDGWKMTAARAAAERLVENLNASDRFAVLAFDTVIEQPRDQRGLRKAGLRERAHARSFLASVEARGGTEMVWPLQTALHYLTASRSSDVQGEAVWVDSLLQDRAHKRLQQERERLLALHSPVAAGPRQNVIVLITDGQVGNEAQLVASFRGPDSPRVFCIGIDQAVNAGLLRQLAQQTGGACELADSEARLEEIFVRLERRIGNPRLQNVSLRQHTREATPARLDVFPGVPAIQFGRLTQVPARAQVCARIPGGGDWRAKLTPTTTTDHALRFAWARSRMLELQRGFDCGTVGAAEITAFSLRTGVLSSFTSFLAVDQQSHVPGLLHRVVQPVERPTGWQEGERTERWRIMQDLQTKVFEITQDVTVNKAKSTDRLLESWYKISLQTASPPDNLCLNCGSPREAEQVCSQCQAAPSRPEMRPSRLELCLEAVANVREGRWTIERFADWLTATARECRERIEACVQQIHTDGIYDYLLEEVELGFSGLELLELALSEFALYVDDQDLQHLETGCAHLRQAMDNIRKATEGTTAFRRSLEEEWGYT